MKKILMTLAAVLCCALLTGTLSSCSSDEFTTQLEVSDALTTDGISAEIDGLVTTFNITSNDSWTITMPEEAEEWIYLPTTSGKGNGEVLVSIDPNFGSAEARSTTLIISAGGQTRQVAVIQRPSYEGQPVANDSASAAQIAIASQKGLGLGYDLSAFKATTNSVINLKAVNKLMESKDAYAYGDLFTYNSEGTAKAQGAVTDSVETKSDSLGVKLSFDITYGKFKLGIKGAYHGYENKTHLSDAYHYGATYNVATASVDLPTIVELCTSPEDYAVNDDDTKPMKSLLTVGFQGAKKKVEAAYKEKASTDSAIQNLINKYGLAVVAGCRLGGDIALQIRFDLDSVGETMHVDQATLTTGIKQGLLKLDAEVVVDYKKQSINLLKNSEYSFEISGGSTEALNDLISALTDIREENDSVDAAVHNRIDAWIRSIKADKSETMSYSNLSVYPIWSFFDGDVSAAVEAYIKKKYPTAYKTLGIK